MSPAAGCRSPRSEDRFLFSIKASRRITTSDLKPWAARVREQPWQAAFVFFKHKETAGGPELADRFAGLFASA